MKTLFCYNLILRNSKNVKNFNIIRKYDMIKGIDNTKTKKKTWKNKIERDTELLQGAYFGGKPEHIIEEDKKRKQKKKK